LTLPGGRKVDANRRGVVEVPDRYDRSIRRSEAHQHYGIVDEASTSFGRSAVEDNICAECAFSMWAWQTECPRCGHTCSTASPPTDPGPSDASEMLAASGQERSTR
jgi:hypothetical protein